jgi:hypothetical protein
MKRIKPSVNAHSWPRQEVKSIECRKRDLIVRIADWTRDKDEPAFDVEVYIGGVYDWSQSESCTFHRYGSKLAAKNAAIKFAQEKIASTL